MLGATAGGFALGTAGTAAAHAIQYPVGALTHTPHGVGVGTLLPYVMEFNRPARVPELAAIGLAMGAPSDASLDDLADEAIDRVAALLASVGIPTTLAELGLPLDRLRWTAEQAMGAERLIANNPRPLDVDILEHIIRGAHAGDRARPPGGPRRDIPARPDRRGGCPVTVMDAAMRPVADAIEVPTELLVGGVWRPAGEGRRIEVSDPATGTVLAWVADADPRDAEAAVDAAAAAAAGWAATAPRHRADLLMRAFELMHDKSEELALLISLENGKSLADARSEVTYAAEFFRWYAEEGVRLRGQVGHSPSGANRLLVTHQPVGVSVLITPWNFPAAMATRKIAPALAAGCTAVLKPAAETPLTALAVAALLQEAGLPAGVLNVITTSDPGPVVEAMLTDRRTRMLSFTGSTEVGRLLLRTAADNVLKCGMELGGNAPFVVLADADIDAALDGAMVAKMRNGGQACTAANRFFVQGPVHDAFVEGLVARMAAVRVGPGTDEKTQCGPLIDAAAVHKVDRLVQDALERGALALLGGRPVDGPGHFYPPTVLVDVPPDARILHEEVFGPVAPVVRFDSEEEMLTMVNDTVFGLVSYLYTGRSRPRPEPVGTHRERHGRPQPRVGLRPCRALRRHQAERPRPRGEHRRTPRVHGDPVRRDLMVTPARTAAPPHLNTTSTTASETAPTKEAGNQMRYAQRARRRFLPVRQVQVAAAALLLATALAACGSDDDGGGGESGGGKAPATIPELTDDPLTLKFIWFEWPPAQALEDFANEYYTKERPNVTIEVNTVPNANWHDAMFTQFAARQTDFDIAILDSQHIGEAVTNGNILDLTDFVEENIDVDAYDPYLLAAYGQYPQAETGQRDEDASLYGLPLLGDTWTMIYRKDLIGESPPRPGTR